MSISHSCTDDLQHIFDLLTRLYAHEDSVIEDIMKCRINPDFTSDIRNDLEFFIPEISSFYLRGKYEEQQSLLNLLTSAWGISFFFSHRLYFFFKSVISTDGSKDVKSECLAAIQEIQEMCEVQSSSDCLLYLANSKDLIVHIKKLKVDGLYPNLQNEIADEESKAGIFTFHSYI